MNDVLQNAIDEMTRAEDLGRLHNQEELRMVMAYAAIATAQAAERQAAAQERIADALENISGAYSIDLHAPGESLDAYKARKAAGYA